MSRLKQMAEMGTMVTVFRDGEMCKISSDDIVPGDVIVMEDHMQVPCDIMLLNGQCVVNESNLTGESIPIIKTGLPFDGGIVTNVDDFKRYVVFSGTTVIQSKAFRKPHVSDPFPLARLHHVRVMMMRSLGCSMC
jgi:cation-transporting P-type ATPase 13A2